MIQPDIYLKQVIAQIESRLALGYGRTGKPLSKSHIKKLQTSLESYKQKLKALNDKKE